MTNEKAEVTVDFPEPSIAMLRISRPEKRNALTRASVRQLREALRELGTRPDLRVIVFSGDSSAFCAGADFSVFSDMGSYPMRERKLMIDEFMDLGIELEEHPLPSIAAVSGAAVGGGMELTLACDLIVASPNARFGSVFVRHGLLPDMGGTYRLSRRVGSGRARDLMLTGRQIAGAEAATMGLVDRLVDQPEATALDMAREMATRSPMSVSLIRRLIRTNLDVSSKTAKVMEALASVVTSGSEEHRKAAWSEREQGGSQ